MSDDTGAGFYDSENDYVPGPDDFDGEDDYEDYDDDEDDYEDETP